MNNFVDIFDGAVALLCILCGLKVEQIWLKNHCCKWRVYLPEEKAEEIKKNLKELTI